MRRTSRACNIRRSTPRVRTRTPGGAYVGRFEYVHRDHLGSVDAVTDAAGTLLNNKTPFDPFGGRRSANWATDITSTALTTLRTNEDERWARGFTDHEMLNRTGFIHMNGRVYDPRIGRFVSADPIVQAPFHSQSYHRYANVMNTPMGASDPTGFMGAGGIDGDGYVGAGPEFDPSGVLGAAHGSDPFNPSARTGWEMRPSGATLIIRSIPTNHSKFTDTYWNDRKGTREFVFEAPRAIVHAVTWSSLRESPHNQVC